MVTVLQNRTSTQREIRLKLQIYTENKQYRRFVAQTATI